MARAGYEHGRAQARDENSYQMLATGIPETSAAGALEKSVASKRFPIRSGVCRAGRAAPGLQHPVFRAWLTEYSFRSHSVWPESHYIRVADCYARGRLCSIFEATLKQIRQFLRSGIIQIGEVPFPGVRSDEVLIRTSYSFVSVGTEKMKVSQARMSLAQKARERPDQVKQVLQTLKEQGLGPTFRKVQERLKAPTTLGYSCAGTVLAV